MSFVHHLDLVVPVDQNGPDATHPFLHETFVSEDTQLLFLGLSFEDVGDGDKVSSGLIKAHVGLDLLVRKMLLGTMAQRAFTHIVAGGEAAFFGFPPDAVALFLRDTRVQVQGAPGLRFGVFLSHC